MVSASPASATSPKFCRAGTIDAAAAGGRALLTVARPTRAACAGLRRIKTHGFTLTETAIALAVVAVIIGAIWVAVGAVIENLKTTTAATEEAAILSSYQHIYALRGIETPNVADVTCNGVGPMNMFPSSMGGNGCVPNSYATYPKNPWGGPAIVKTREQDQTISIEFDGLSKDACIRLASRFPASPDIIQVIIIGAFADDGQAPPISPATAAALCVTNIPGESLGVSVSYKARQ